MTGKYIVAKITSTSPIEGADRIVSSNVYGETVIISASTPIGTKGLLIDCESALDKNLVSKLNMFRDSNMNVDKETKGYIEENCRVRPITLKGTKCSGLFISEEQLNNIGIQLPDIGVEGNDIKGTPICTKYIPRKIKSASKSALDGRYKNKDSYVPTFKEHVDTDQWGRNMDKVEEGDLVIITEKLHGTSLRCANLPVLRNKPWYERLLNRLGISTVDSEYKFVVGSRRVLKSIDGNESDNKLHYYGHDLWSVVADKHFKGLLRKGETVYAEIVGYDLDGNPIMGSHSNEKLKNFMSKDEYKKFIDRYGDTTTFTYGCTNETISYDTAMSTYNQEPIFNEVYVYRITMTNENGQSIDYSWEQVKQRCEELDVLHVPELMRFIATPYSKNDEVFLADHYGEEITKIVDKFTEMDSIHFPQHLNEGVCIRIENGSLTPQIYKSKRYLFKCIEGIIKDTDVVDVEESN